MAFYTDMPRDEGSLRPSRGRTVLDVGVVVLVIFGLAERLEKYLLRWNRA